MNSVFMTKNNFRILQLTDLHLMNKVEDDQTYDLIKQSIRLSHPDFIVITGDITMVPQGEALLNRLREQMDSYQIPWTFVFGNHDYESNLSLDEQADILMKGDYCQFKKGNPHFRGLGNYYITLEKHGKIVAMLGFLDSHNNRMDEIKGEMIWSYDYIDKEQISEAVKQINELKKKNIALSSVFFFHIPLVEYKTEVELNYWNILGNCFEPISCSRYNTHFFSEVVKTNTLKGIFVGHDHVCDFSFMKEGCLFAFGRCTGHYNYTMPEFKKGARVIDIDETGQVSSYVIIEE